MIEPCEQFANEVTACLRRWSEESDMESIELAEIACEAINEWMEDLLNDSWQFAILVHYRRVDIVLALLIHLVIDRKSFE